MRIVALAVALLAAAPAFAQPYPSKPLRFIVGYAPGGGTDIMARAVAAKLPELLRQQVVVENRPGANANLGAEYAARQPADGYTVLFISVSHAMSKSVYKNLGYDLERDFVPLTIVSEVPNVLTVHPSLPAKNVKELVALAKAKPGTITLAVAGLGSPGHFAGAMLEMMGKVKLLVVPYKGGGPLNIDLMAGHVMSTFNALPPLLGNIKAGQTRAIAVSTAKRVKVLPDVPTVGETIPGFAVSTWYGCVVRTGTPEEIVQQLSAAAQKVVAMPDVQATLSNLGATIVGGDSARSAAFIKAEVAKYAKVAKAADIKAE
ncbi:MAG TPA: tripartite tricarboxylate transporter substrate binding protein [Burkholderiales bacterium]|nr:tripartite tricarboxylate transporter substrate binding protein [Burkholderiales bacterium]